MLPYCLGYRCVVYYNFYLLPPPSPTIMFLFLWDRLTFWFHIHLYCQFCFSLDANSPWPHQNTPFDKNFSPIYFAKVASTILKSCSKIFIGITAFVLHNQYPLPHHLQVWRQPIHTAARRSHFCNVTTALTNLKHTFSAAVVSALGYLLSASCFWKHAPLNNFVPMRDAFYETFWL